MKNTALRDLAIKELVLSPLMEGREKLRMEDLVKRYPNGVTITAVDMIPDTKSGELYSLFTFKEDETKFASGGVIFNKIAKKWLEAYDYNIHNLSHDLTEESIVIIFYYDKTSNKRDVVKCEIV